MLVFILSCAAAVVVSFFCSMAEAILLSLNPVRLETLGKEGKAYAKAWLDLKKNVDRPIAAILILNTVAHTGGATAFPTPPPSGIIHDLHPVDPERENGALGSLSESKPHRGSPCFPPTRTLFEPARDFTPAICAVISLQVPFAETVPVALNEAIPTARAPGATPF